jgi:hypothetical protein
VCLRCSRTRYSFRKNDLSVDYTSLMERFNTRRNCSSRELTSAFSQIRVFQQPRLLAKTRDAWMHNAFGVCPCHTTKNNFRSVLAFASDRVCSKRIFDEIGNTIIQYHLSKSKLPGSPILSKAWLLPRRRRSFDVVRDSPYMARRLFGGGKQRVGTLVGLIASVQHHVTI